MAESNPLPMDGLLFLALGTSIAFCVVGIVLVAASQLLAIYLRRKQLVSKANSLIDGGPQGVSQFLDLPAWYPRLAPLTFRSEAVTMDREGAEALRRAAEDALAPTPVPGGKLRPEDYAKLEALRKLLDGAIVRTGGTVFVKFCGASPKDAAVLKTGAREAAVAELDHVRKEVGECVDSTAVAYGVAGVRGASQALRCSNAEEALWLLVNSYRVWQEVSAALSDSSGGDDNFSISVRAFEPQLRPETKLRGFVCNGRLTALSQCFMACRVPALADNPASLRTKVHSFFEKEVRPRLTLDRCIVDFALLEDGALRLVDLRSFGRETNACLFNWDADGPLLTDHVRGPDKHLGNDTKVVYRFVHGPHDANGEHLEVWERWLRGGTGILTEF